MGVIEVSNCASKVCDRDRSKVAGQEPEQEEKDQARGNSRCCKETQVDEVRVDVDWAPSVVLHRCQ